MKLGSPSLQIETGQHAGTLQANRVQSVNRKPERLKNRRRHLLVCYGAADGRGLEAWIRHDEGSMGVIRREAAVLGNLGRALAVDRAGNGLHD